MPEFVSVRSKATGRKRMVPPHWLDDPKLGPLFEKTPLQKQADKASQLKGKALAAALQEANLPAEGSADDQRAALEAYYAEQAAVDAANNETGDGPTGPLETTTDTPHGGDTEGA